MIADVMFKRLSLGFALLFFIVACRDAETPPAGPPTNSTRVPAPVAETTPRPQANVEWKIPSLPDLDKEIGVPSGLFELTREEKINSARLVERLQRDPRIEWPILVLDHLPRGHARQPAFSDYAPRAQDRPLTEFFNAEEGRELTVWAKGSTREALGQFLPPGWDGKGAVGVVLLSAAADPLTVLHELLHGFYLRTFQSAPAHHPVRDLQSEGQRLVDKMSQVGGEEAKSVELGVVFYLFLAESQVFLEEARVHARIFAEAERLAFPIDETLSELLPVVSYLERMKERERALEDYLVSYVNSSAPSSIKERIDEIRRYVKKFGPPTEKLRAYVAEKMP